MANRAPTSASLGPYSLATATATPIGLDEPRPFDRHASIQARASAALERARQALIHARAAAVSDGVDADAATGGMDVK